MRKRTILYLGLMALLGGFMSPVDAQRPRRPREFFTALNNVNKADEFPGSNAGEQIEACIFDLPGTGGICDARGFQGNQVISADPFLGQKDVHLILGVARFLITANVTFPERLVLEMTKGSILVPSGGVTVTIAGPLIAPQSQIFTTSGTIEFDQASTVANPLWWGALGDGINNDTAALQAAIDAAEALVVAGNRGTVFCPPGDYNITSGLTINQSIIFSAFGSERNSSCIISKQGDFVGITVTIGGAEIDGVRVTGIDSPQLSSTAHGFLVNNQIALRASSTQNGGHGVFLDANTNLNTSRINLVTDSNGGDGLRIEDNNNPTAPNANVIWLDYVKSRNNTGDGVHILNGINIRGFLNTDSNTGHGLHISQTGAEVNQDHIFWVHSEGNTGNDINITGTGATGISLYTNSAASPIIYPADQNILLKHGFGGHTFESRGGFFADAMIWKNENAGDAGDRGVRTKVLGSSGVVLWQAEYGGSGITTITTDPGDVRSAGIGTYIFSGGVFRVATAFTFATLPSPSGNGGTLYCSDCLRGSVPCSGASTGSMAKRENAAWNCD